MKRSITEYEQVRDFALWLMDMKHEGLALEWRRECECARAAIDKATRRK